MRRMNMKRFDWSANDASNSGRNNCRYSVKKKLETTDLKEIMMILKAKNQIEKIEAKSPCIWKTNKALQKMNTYRLTHSHASEISLA